MDKRRQWNDAHMVVAITLRHQIDRDRETEIGDERKRMGRVHGQRRQDREDVRTEIGIQFGPVLLVQVLDAEHVDAFGMQLLLQAAPPRLLFRDQLQRGVLDPLHLFGRRQAILAGLHHPGPDLFPQAGIAHHLELIEIAGRNRQEPQSFQERMIVIGGFFQDAPIELKPGEFPVQEPFRRFHPLVLGKRLSIGHDANSTLQFGSRAATFDRDRPSPVLQRLPEPAAPKVPGRFRSPYHPISLQRFRLPHRKVPASVPDI